VNRGSALVDTLVAAFITALFLQGAVAAAQLQAAGETAHEAAAVAAAWAARYGDTAEAASLARALAPEAESVSVRTTAGGLAVTVLMRVPLAGPEGQVAPVVVGRAVVAVSPYRSNRE
jgi:hypothetical protein